MENESSTNNASTELSQLILDLDINELNEDFAAADTVAKDLIQVKPIELPTSQAIEPLVKAPSLSEESAEKPINDIVQDINLTELDKLNQGFTEQSERNNKTEKPENLPQQSPSAQTPFTPRGSQPPVPVFDEEAFKKEMEDKSSELKKATSHLGPVPDIFLEKPSSETSISKVEKKDTTVSKNEPAVKPVESQKEKFPDWVTMPLKKESKEDTVVKDQSVLKSGKKLADNQVKTELPSTPTQPAAVNTEPLNVKMTNSVALREDNEKLLKKPESSKGLKPFSEAQATEVPKQESKGITPGRPLDNPNIANQIQSVLKGVNDLSPALDVFNFKAYVNQGIKEGAAAKGVSEVTDMESLLKQLPFTSTQNQQPTERTQQSEQPSPEQPFTPFNFNLGATIPSMSERRSPMALASNNDRSLIGINQNLNKISISLQQTQQTLVNSLNTLNNTAMEILRTIPSISVQQGQSGGFSSNSNKSNFTPTESLNLIGNFRDRLGLTPRTFTNNTVFPGNNSIA